MDQPTSGTGMANMACKCPHHKVAPAAIALIGLSFLLTALGLLSAATTGLIWPVLLIVIGLVKMGGCKCCSRP